MLIGTLDEKKNSMPVPDHEIPESKAIGIESKYINGKGLLGEHLLTPHYKKETSKSNINTS